MDRVGGRRQGVLGGVGRGRGGDRGHEGERGDAGGLHPHLEGWWWEGRGDGGQPRKRKGKDGVT